MEWGRRFREFIGVVRGMAFVDLVMLGFLVGGSVFLQLHTVREVVNGAWVEALYYFSVSGVMMLSGIRVVEVDVFRQQLVRCSTLLKRDVEREIEQSEKMLKVLEEEYR